MPDDHTTPGPFLGSNDFAGRLTVCETREDGCKGTLATVTTLMDRKHLVELLNKGTHFDHMLAALRLVNEEQEEIDRDAVEAFPDYDPDAEPDEIVHAVRTSIRRATGKPA